jgi:hypothetical protein
MFWLYLIAGCFFGLTLFFVILYIIAKVRNSLIKSDFDIAY